MSEQLKNALLGGAALVIVVLVAFIVTGPTGGGDVAGQAIGSHVDKTDPVVLEATHPQNTPPPILSDLFYQGDSCQLVVEEGSVGSENNYLTADITKINCECTKDGPGEGPSQCLAGIIIKDVVTANCGSQNCATCVQTVIRGTSFMLSEGGSALNSFEQAAQQSQAGQIVSGLFVSPATSKAACSGDNPEAAAAVVENFLNEFMDIEDNSRAETTSLSFLVANTNDGIMGTVFAQVPVTAAVDLLNLDGTAFAQQKPDRCECDSVAGTGGCKLQKVTFNPVWYCEAKGCTENCHIIMKSASAAGEAMNAIH